MIILSCSCENIRKPLIILTSSHMKKNVYVRKFPIDVTLQFKNHFSQRHRRSKIMHFIHSFHQLRIVLLYKYSIVQKNHKMLQNKKVQTALLNKYD